MINSALDDRLEAKEVLKLAGISRATLTRWMDPTWVEGRGLSGVFPSGELRDGKTKVWPRHAVEGWLEENAQKLGRHRSNAPRALSEYHSIPLPLEKALTAAVRADGEDKGLFDVSAHIEAIENELANALRSKGVTKVKWNGTAFDFFFPKSEKGDEDRVYFLLAYT